MATRRGRPKGTGIDDSATLAEVARLLAGEPGLKPTTAIKALGITDPSVIRRLRDKFHAFDAAAATPAVQGADEAAIRRKHKGRTSDADVSRRQVAAARKGSEHRRSEPRPKQDGGDAPVRNAAQPATGHVDAGTAGPTEAATPPAAIPQAGQAGDTARFPTPQDVIASLYGLGFAATSQAISTQISLAEQMVRMPYVRIALRNQLALNAWAFGLSGTSTAAKFRS